jgi:cobalt/nickel transport system permease protein
MHLPDGFLDAKTAIATGVLAAAGLGIALRQAEKHLPARKVPILGVAAAFVFAAQMLNFPIGGGTSGHLIGGVLAAALLGPSAAVVVLTAVLLVQCFMFADGGITALGANIFNMGLIGSVGGWAIYRPLSHIGRGPQGQSLQGQVFAATVAGWASTMLASIACAGELAVSGTPWSMVFPAMAGSHMLIGIGEGIITAMVLAAVGKSRPDLLDPSATVPAASYKPLLAYGALIAVGLALFVSPFASAWPDGLEKVAGKLGIEHKAAQTRSLPALLPDYKVAGIGSGALATSIAGVSGTAIVFGLAWVLAKALVPARKPEAVEVSSK